MIRPIVYKQTKLYISSQARQMAHMLYGGDETAAGALALESIRNYVDKTLNTRNLAVIKKPKGFWAKLKNRFQTKSKLMITINVDETGDHFVLSTRRDVNKLIFRGKEVPVSIYKARFGHKELDAAVRASKEGILDAIKEYNKTKKLFDIRKFF